MIVVNRFKTDSHDFVAQLSQACEILSSKPGFSSGHLGRNVDDPSLWLMVTVWENVGSYRRALSAYDVKMNVVPVLNHVIDEPSAYEGLDGDLNLDVPRDTADL